MSQTMPPRANRQSQHGITLFLGMVRRGECESLLRHGHPLGILVDINNRHQLADVTEFAFVGHFDFSRPQSELIAAVRAIDETHGLTCLLNVMEFYVAQTAAVAEAMGMPSISTDAAARCRDKCVMRRRFLEHIGPTAAARFEVVDSESDLLARASELGYPVFLQPSNVAASMWSSRNTTPEALIKNYQKLQEDVPKYLARLGKHDQRHEVVLAEYLHGQNTSVDCLIDASGCVYPTPVVDVWTGADVGIDDYHHFARILPSSLHETTQVELQRLSAAGIHSLEMRSCAAHVEFIGTRIGEIAARPGGNRARILDLALGIDLLDHYAQMLTGNHINLQSTKQKSAAIVTPFARRDGILKFIRHLDRIINLPCYLDHEIKIPIGQAVGLSKNGWRAPLYIELQSDDADAIRRDVQTIASWTDLYDVD